MKDDNLMPWYSKKLTMSEIIDQTNESIRKDFSYIYNNTNFRPKNIFLISVRNADKGVSLFISPVSSSLMGELIKRYAFQLSDAPSGGRMSLIVGDEREFNSMLPETRKV